MEINSPANSPPPRSATNSPPPKCAICLGTFTNKCYSNSCMHQFCFKCLLEWSKVKPECPLCKQSFKSIIHNIKSNDEYDEHIVEPPPQLGVPNLGNGEFLYLPPAPSRHFQFRTTFTVDPRGEFAIQQMLLSHPLTNTMYNMHAGNYLPRHGNGRFRLRHPRRASSATSFRRSIYDLGLWVRDLGETNGRTRDINPNFFRENPTARHRLAPWLNRELNALLRENTQQVMTLVDIIMDHLTRWHIRSRSFKILLQPHLDTKTDHFIHEFSNYMKSPYDMITYDRHIIYTERPLSPTLFIVSDHEDDSDVTIVNTSEPVTRNNNPFQSPTIEVIEINSDSSHDSDIIIGENPEPEIVNLIDSDTNDPSPSRVDSHRHSTSEESRKPILPLKVRLKRKHQTRESRYQNRQCCTKIQANLSRSRSPITTTTTSSSSSDSSDVSISSEPHKYKRKYKYKYKKTKTRNSKPHKVNKKPTRYMDQFNDDSSSTSSASNSDSEDNLPPCKLRRRKGPETNRSYQIPPSRTHTVTTKNLQSLNMEAGTSTQQIDDEVKPSCSLWDTSAGLNNRIDTPPQFCASSSLLDGSGRLSELERNLSFDDYLFPEYTTPNNNNNNTELYNNSQQYEPPLSNFSPYNSPRVGPRYYDCDYSIRGEMYPVMHNSNYAIENPEGFVQPKIEVPSRVTVTPHETDTASSSYFTHSDSHNKRLQSVIVKKEDYLLSDSSDN